MNPFERFPQQFRVAGTVTLDACPVCGSDDLGELWRLPQSRLPANSHLSAPGSRADGFYIDYLPLLTAPQEVFKFDLCGRCETIFLNPKSDDHAIYLHDTSKVASYREKGTTPLEGAAKLFLRDLAPDTRRVVEFACGAGQVLTVMREARPELHLTGLELSHPSVDFIRDELGLDAHQVDIDHDDLDAIVPPGTADFVIAQEAFEHVRAPVTLVRKMARMLRPGGRAYLTAQFWGDNALQIRVGEPIYINDRGVEHVLAETGLTLVRMKKDVKMRMLLEKPGAPFSTAPTTPTAQAAGPAPAPAAAKPKRRWWQRG